MNTENVTEYVPFNAEDMLEVTLKEKDDFLKVRETLTRIGISSRRSKKLIQSCLIFHKRGKYFIVHFKEMFGLDGKPTTITTEDIKRRNTIAKLLSEWKLVELVKEINDENCLPLKQIKILPYSKKDEWELVTKYNIGNIISPSEENSK